LLALSGLCGGAAALLKIFA
jgi:hypothetical protein